MKWILFFVVLFCSFAQAQNIYFSEPLSGHSYPIYSSGQGPINYNMYAANGWVIYHYYARLYYPEVVFLIGRKVKQGVGGLQKQGHTK